MPLMMNKLPASGALTSKNRILRDVTAMTIRYNSLPATTSAKDKIDTLHLICRLAGDYLTSKPPQTHSYKNQMRWEGLTELMEQMGKEAASLGVRMITGPSNYKDISGHQRSYWLETLDPMHRPGYVLSPKYQAWLTNVSAVQTKQSFWSYVGTRNRGAEYAEVAYLNELDGPKKYEVAFDDDGLLSEVMGGAPYSTAHHETAFSGDGWGIFVVSPTGQMYSGSHIVGKFHHSSFLGGRPVMAAGELVVDDGVVKVVTAKSGHYRPSKEDLLRFVQNFTRIPSDAIVRPDLSDETNSGGLLFFYAGEFRTKGMNARPLSKQEVLQAVPVWAKSPEAMREFDKLIDVRGAMKRKLGRA